jgi:hypothetical protein
MGGEEADGRAENIDIRERPPSSPKKCSGPYLEGRQMPERLGKAGVDVAGETIPLEKYKLMQTAGFVPMREEMSTEEFLTSIGREGIGPEQVAGFIDELKERLSHYVPLYPAHWDETAKNQLVTAERDYQTWFHTKGEGIQGNVIWAAPPALDILRWAFCYQLTGDDKWAEAVRDIHHRFYHTVRPPAQKIKDQASDVKTMWHPLTCGSQTPLLVEAYVMISGSPILRVEDHLDFLKGFYERGNFLRYTTVPYEPWPDYNPFGYGNWILYQLEGLLAVSATFPEFVSSEEWRSHAVTGIGVHADWWVMPDSGGSEYSYDYTSQVAGQLEWCYLMLAQHRIPFPDRFRSNVFRLHEVFLSLATPAGQKIPFGDSARGNSFVTARSRWAAIAFLNPEFKFWAGRVDERYLKRTARALEPEDPAARIAAFQNLVPVAPEVTSHILPEAGWAIMRSDWSPQATVLALAYRGSENIYHAGYETLGLNLWSGEQALMVKLLGRNGYERGYPEGYHRTPSAANLVMIDNAGFRRVSGSLRNWFSSASLDYFSADHRGWGRGVFLSSRRILFLKPDWIVVIDDVENRAGGSIAASWQAHTGAILPKVNGRVAELIGKTGSASVYFMDAQPRMQALSVPGFSETEHLLSAKASGPTPLRFVTLIRVGNASAEPGAGENEKNTIPYRSLQSEGAEGVELLTANGREEVWWESSAAEVGKFLVWKGSGTSAFFAGDGNDNPALMKFLEHFGGERVWNGRCVSTLDGTLPEISAGVEIAAESVTAFSWSGLAQLREGASMGRVSWQTEKPARHSVLYRKAGDPLWMREFQPGLYQRAWILIPDLKPGQEYELKVVSEFPDGRIRRSPVFQRINSKDK